MLMLMLVKYLNLSKCSHGQDSVKLLIFVSLFSIGISVLIVDLILFAEHVKTTAVGVLLILLIFANNILILGFFQRLSDAREKNYRQYLLLEELKVKAAYYKEVEVGNKKVLQIKHDFKNKVLAMQAMVKENENTEGFWEELVESLENSAKSIFTKNMIFQTVIGHKIAVARRKGIECSVNVSLPQKINMDYRDCGVLLGNLLDNAIEAAQFLEISKRWITVKVVYKEKVLLIIIQNSKINKKINIKVSSKSDKFNHGHGLISVADVVKKYNGEIEFMDHGEDIEVSIVLYDIYAVN